MIFYVNMSTIWAIACYKVAKNDPPLLCELSRLVGEIRITINPINPLAPGICKFDFKSIFLIHYSVIYILSICCMISPDEFHRFVLIIINHKLR